MKKTMKYRYLLPLFLTCAALFSYRVSAQMIGDNIFLKGQWMECTVASNGSWGNTITVPAGYHTHGSSSLYADPATGISPTGNGLDFSYDLGHDGWGAGAPDFFHGAFFLPGTPFDGWNMQVDGVMSSAFYTDIPSGGFNNTLGGTLTGNVFSYSNVGGNKFAVWKGSAGIGGALKITQTHEVDSFASWVKVTIKYVNKSLVPMRDCYYMVTADPDNEVPLGGSFGTDNHISYQNDALHRSEVNARPATPSSRPNCFSGLAAKDCRARALIYQTWPPPMDPSDKLDSIWNQIGGDIAPANGKTAKMDSIWSVPGRTTWNQDIAYGMLFRLGDIDPNDSAEFAFAWIFSDTTAIDSVFPSAPPILRTETTVMDTIVGCSVVGGIAHVVLPFGPGEDSWLTQDWTWSPAIGLSATTGTSVDINIGKLSKPVLYTAIAQNNYSCAVRIFKLYVTPCFFASSDTVCETDTAHLYSIGDSTGATFRWINPMGVVVDTLQNTFIAPVSAADTGTYIVERTKGGIVDSTTTHLTIRFLPHVTATADTPCSQTTLSLKATLFDPGVTFAWTGPNSFTSVTQNPTIPTVPTKDAGLYKVVTTLNGCSDSGYVTVKIDTTPVIPVAKSNSSGLPGEKMICAGDTLLLFATDATTFPIDYSWTGPGTFTSTDQNPMIAPASNASAGVYSVTATIGKCFTTGGTNVKIAPVPPLAATSNSPVCSGGFHHLDLQATSLPGATFTWTGPHTFFSADQNPVRLPVLMDHAGVYKVVVLLNGCTTFRYDTVVVNETPLAPWTKWLTFCQYYLPDPLQAMGENILWYTAHKDTMIGSKFAPVPNTNIVGETFYYATQTVKGCISPLDSMKITVYPTPSITMSENVVVCPHESATLKSTNTDALAYYHWFPSTYLSDTVSAVVVVRPETNIHYTLVASNMFGCTDTARVAVTVKAGAVLEAGDSATIYPGEKYQLNAATNCTYITWFPSTGLSDAHITNPVASPLVSTRYIATGMTEFGCKVKDSIDIRVSKETLLDLPNAFTPGSGSNSKFKILKRGIADLKSFSVYNRWGQKVFETANIDEGWDGSFNGKPQLFGVYVYEVIAVTSSGEDFVKTGNVTLIR